jgi:F-type H+-transporting ATPase subunit alpha
MTIAEYFRDQGKDVLIILDDLTAHAKYYREITLLARRFPGRSSYPGDIFYTHSRLMERAGNFEKGSITCLPVAESVLGDLSGYIQTNLMAMTDGHIFLDVDLFNEGRRPAVNPFLSVTRVGLQAQSPLLRDLNRQLTAFLAKVERMRQFMHFGAEVSKSVQETLQLGAKINAFFSQQQNVTIPVNVGVYVLASLWSGIWKDSSVKEVHEKTEQIIDAYMKDTGFREKVDTIIMGSPSFKALVESVTSQGVQTK